MYYIEVNNRIKQIVNLFHGIGMWRIKDETTGFRKILWKLSYIFLNMPFCVLLITGGIFAEDDNESVYLFAVGIADVVATFKLIYVLWKKKQILELINEIGAHSVEDCEEYLKVNEKVKKYIKFSYSFFSFIFVGCVILITISLPVFPGAKNLPFNVSFDWKNNTFVYYTVDALQVTGMLIGFIAALLNLIMCYLLLNCSIKYQILGNEFRNMFLPKPTFKNRKLSEQEQEDLLLQKCVGLIKSHQNIQRMIDRFKSCFANLFFAQITTSGICICCSVYAMAFSGEISVQSVFYTVVFLYNLFDIFLVMYLGNEIKLSSDRLSYSLFESNWLERSESCKKCMIVLTEVLKQPHELVIGKLYPLNLETFTSILNLAYSMFNILQNLK